MTIKLIEYPIVLAFLITSCQVRDKENVNKLVSLEITNLKISPVVKLSDLGFCDIEYIPLGYSNNCQIPTINNIIFSKHFFIVQHYTTILKFSNNGSCISRIGSIGRGPGELLVAHDIEINERNKDIYIVDGWRRIFYVFSENGTFKRTFPCPINTINFRFCEDQILCYSTNYIGNIEFSYNLLDTCGIIIKKIVNKYPWEYNKTGTAIFIENIFFRYNGRLYKKEVYSDTIYLFNNTGFVPYMVVKQGKSLLTTKARSDFNPEFLLEHYTSQWNLFLFGKYLYFEFSINRKLYGLIGSVEEDTQVIIDPQIGIINDIDGGPYIRPRTIRNDSTLVSWINANEFKKYINSDVFKESKPLFPERKKALEKLAASLKETDNPVLILVHLKK